MSIRVGGRERPNVNLCFLWILSELVCGILTKLFFDIKSPNCLVYIIFVLIIFNRSCLFLLDIKSLISVIK